MHGPTRKRFGDWESYKREDGGAGIISIIVGWKHRIMWERSMGRGRRRRRRRRRRTITTITASHS